MNPCSAILTSHRGGSYEKCTRAGTVYQGSGRWLCKQHHQHSAFVDDGRDHSVSDEQRQRMARVMSGE